MRFLTTPALERDDLILRPLATADISAWYAYLALPEVVEHTSWDLTSVDDLRPLIEWYDSGDPSSAIRFAICSALDGTLVGTIGFHTISTRNRTAEVAFDLDPVWWGCGIASACCRAIVAWGFADRRYFRIQATALDSNARSIRMLEHCGFAYEGTLRNYRIVRGVPGSFRMYSIISENADVATEFNSR